MNITTERADVEAPVAQRATGGEAAPRLRLGRAARGLALITKGLLQEVVYLANKDQKSVPSALGNLTIQRARVQGRI